MSRDPDAEHHNIDHGDDRSGYPFDLYDQPSIFRNDINSVDDNLHEQLDFEYPEEQQPKEYWNTTWYHLCQNSTRKRKTVIKVWVGLSDVKKLTQAV